MKQKLFTNIQESSDDEDEVLNDSVLDNLKNNFGKCTRNKQLMILTCLPQSWSVRKIMQEFNAPNYMVRQ